MHFDLVDAVLEESGKFAAEVLHPLNAVVVAMSRWGACRVLKNLMRDSLMN